jgi:uncharacterized protein YutE (UPF0331/DUF86 family)
MNNGQFDALVERHNLRLVRLFGNASDDINVLDLDRAGPREHILFGENDGGAFYMSPRRFDPGIVERRLASMRDLLKELERAGLDDATEMCADRLARHVAERILIALVEHATGINSHVVAAARGRAPTSYTHSFELAAEHGLISRELADELIPSVELRNVLMYEYLEIDLEKVAAAVKFARDGYRRYLRAVADFAR